MVLGLAACVLFLGATFSAKRDVWGVVALASLALAGIALGFVHEKVPTIETMRAELNQTQPDEKDPAPAVLDAKIYAAPVVLTRLALFFKVIALLTGVVLVLFGWNEAGDQ